MSPVRALLDAALDAALDDGIDAIWLCRLGLGEAGTERVIARSAREAPPAEALDAVAALPDLDHLQRPVVLSLADRSVGRPARSALHHLGAGAVLAVPLALPDASRALLHVASRSAGAFDAGREARWVALGEQLTRSLDRAADSGQATREGRAAAATQALILAIARAAVSHGTVDAALAEVVEGALAIDPVHSAGIALLDHDGRLVVRAEAAVAGWNAAGEPMTGGEWAIDPAELGEGRPHLVTIGGPSSTPAEAALLRHHGAGAILILPLRAGDTPLGVFQVRARAVDAFPATVVDRWLDVARQTAITIRTIRSSTVAAREAERQSILRQASDLIARTTDRRTAFRRISELGLQLPGVDACGIQLWDEATGLVEVGYEVTVPEWPGVAEAGTLLTPAEAWPFSRLLEERQPIHHWVGDPLAPATESDYLAEAGIGSLLECPMVADGRLLGSLGFYARARAPFPRATRELAAELATQTALGVREMMVREIGARVSDERAMLLRVSTAANSSLDLDTVLAEIASAILGLAGAERCKIFLRSPGSATLVMAGSASVADWPLEPVKETDPRYRIGAWGIDAEVVSTRRPIVIGSLADPRVDEAMRTDLCHDGAASVLVWPLWSDDAFVGSVCIFSRRPNVFDAAAVALMGDVALQTMAAVRNARLLEKERRSSVERALFLEITTAAGSDVTPAELLQLIARAGLSVSGTESCEIDLYDPARHELEIGALVSIDGWANAFTANPGDRYAVDHWVLDARAVASTTPIVIHDLGDPRLDAAMRADCLAHDIHSLVLYPLRSHGRCLGILTLFSRQPNVYGEAELAMAGGLAARAGAAIQHALATERERNLAAHRGTLLRISAAATSSLDLATMLAQVAAELKAATGVAALTVELWRPELDAFEVALRLADRGPIQAPAPGTRFPSLGDIPSQRILASTAPFMVDLSPTAFPDREEARLRSRGAGTIICSPLWAGERSLGAIVLYDPREQLLDEVMSELLEEASGHIALAVANARLVETERRRSLERSVLLEVGRATTADLPLAERLRRVAEACLAIPEVEGATISDYFPERGVAVTVADVAVADWPDVDEPGTVYPLGDVTWLADWITHGRARINDVDDPACPPEMVAEIRGFGGQASLWVGLRLADETFGGLGFHTRRRGALDDATVAVATEIAAQISLTIRNARLFDETRRRAAEQEALLKTSRAATSSLDIDVMLTEASRALREVTQTQAVAVERWLPDDDVFLIVSRVTVWDWAGSDAPGTRIPRSSCDFYDRVLADRRAWTVDAADVPPGHPFLDDVARHGVQSMLLAPLWTQDTCLGVIAMVDRRPRYYSAAMVQLAEQAAGQIALAMANVGLLERERQRADDRATLLQISREVTASHDLGTILGAAAERLRVGTGFDVVEVERWRPELDLFEVVGTSTGSDPALADAVGVRTRRSDFPLYDQVLANVGAVSLRASQLPVASAERAALERYTVETAILAPLTANDDVFGMLALYAQGDTPVTDRILRLAEEAAGHIALAMANADLLEQERRQALEQAVMAKVGQAAIAATDLAAKLCEIADICLEIPEVEGVTVEYLYRDRGLVEIAADATVPDWDDPDPVGKLYHRTPEDWVVQWRQGSGTRVFDVADPALAPRTRADILGYGGATSLWDGVELDDDTAVLVGFHSRASGVFTTETSRFAATIAAQTGLAIRNARLLAEAQRHAAEQAALLRVSRAIATVTPESLAESLQQIAALSMNVVAADLCEILLWHRDLDATEIVAQVYSPAWTGNREQMNVLLPLAGRTVAHDVLHERRSVVMRPDPAVYSTTELERIWSDGTRSGLCAPLVFGDRAIGLIGYFTARPDAFDEHHASLAVDLGAQTALAIERATTLAALAEQATTDGLTGLLNHRAIRDRLDAELLRARRGGEPVAVFMVDLNRFKQTNDTHGHLIGDQVLQQAATILTAAARQTDIVGRYGGDEFLVILPNTDAVEAVLVADRILALAAETTIPLPNGELLTPSLSIGFAVYPTDAASRPELVESADRAMYDAKSRTRRPVAHGTDPLRLVPAAGASPLPPDSLATAR